MLNESELWTECRRSFAAGDYSEAWLLLQEFTCHYPRRADAHALAGQIAVMRRQWRQAVLAFRKAARAGRSTEAALMLPLAAAELQADMVTAAYQRLLDCQPAADAEPVRFGEQDHAPLAWRDELLAAARERLHHDNQLLTRFLQHGERYREVHRPERSIHCYRTYLEFAPDSFEAYYGLGEALSACHQDRAALDAYQRAVATAPEEIAPRKKLGFAYIRLGEREKAAEVWRGLVNQHPGERFVAHYLEALTADRLLPHPGERL